MCSFYPTEELEPIILRVERQIIEIIMLECLKLGLLWKNRNARSASVAHQNIFQTVDKHVSWERFLCYKHFYVCNGPLNKCIILKGKHSSP